MTIFSDYFIKKCQEAGLLQDNGRRVSKPRGKHKGKVSADRLEKAWYNYCLSLLMFVPHQCFDSALLRIITLQPQYFLGLTSLSCQGSSRLSSASSTSTAPTELEVYGHDNSEEALEIQNQVVEEKHGGEEEVAEEVEFEEGSMIVDEDEGFDEMDELLHCSGIGAGWETDMEPDTSEEEKEPEPPTQQPTGDPTLAETLPLELTEESQWKVYPEGTPPKFLEVVVPKDTEEGTEIESADEKNKKKNGRTDKFNSNGGTTDFDTRVYII